VVTNGVGLEAGLLDVVDAAEADGVAVLRLGDLLDPHPFTAVDEHDHEDEAGHEDEDEADHGYGNGLDPHIWMDPVRVADGVPLIAARLLEAGGVDVTEEAAAYREAILDLHQEISTLVDEIPSDRRKMVTNHFSYGYYADRYGLQMLGTVIPAATTAAETSAADFAALVELLKQEQVPVIFGSTTEPAALAEVLAEEVGYDVNVVTLYTGSLGEPGSGAETYVDMMLATTRLIVENLR
jgi:zinc/manganese transport system substrate-binding protein